jgi:hypothetical protein
MGDDLTAGLLGYLSGGTSFREKYLPEASDIRSYLKPSVSSNALGNILINPLKDELLAKALVARNMMKGRLRG